MRRMRVVQDNLDIPPPPIPPQLMTGGLEEQKPKFDGDIDEAVGEPIVESVSESVSGEESDTVKDERGEEDAILKGSIHVNVMDGSIPRVEFMGNLTGSDIDVVWRAIFKSYKVWKNNKFKAGEKEKKK